MNPTLTVWLQLIGLLAIEVAVIVGIAAQLQRLTRQAAWRRTIWQSCILGLLLLVVFEFTGVARGILAWTAKRAAATSPVLSRMAVVDSVTSFQPLRQLPQARADHSPAAGMREARVAQPVPFHAANALTTPGPGVKERPGVVVAAEPISVLWLGLVWLMGGAIVMGRALVSRIVLEILRWKRGGIEDATLRESLQALAPQLRISRRIRLAESAHFCSPAAFGIFRPTIGLPLQFGVKYNSVQREAMLAHELAHLAGNDPAWYLLADILAAALWWHPLAWWARRQLQAQSELAADEASLLVADGPGILAECLVELGGRLARTRPMMPLGVAGDGFRSGLGRRVERLVKLDGAAWRPPDPFRCGLARSLGPVALAAAAILCTAWVVPPALTKGENMQTMKQTWKKSLAAFALLTALGPDVKPALAEPTEPSPNGTSAFFGPVTAGGGGSGGSAIVSSGSAGAQRQIFAGGGGDFGTTATTSKEQRLIEEKLNRITLASVHYNGLPLIEVINNLIETSAKQEAGGINFVLNRETPAPVAGPGAIDPATGLPLPTGPVESPDLGSVTVNVNPPLKNVRLIDMLDVITKTADRPIHYSIEDYGVLFSAGAAKPDEFKGGKTLRSHMEILSKLDADRVQTVKSFPASLEVMTFTVNDNTFFANVERTFGEKVPTGNPAEVKAALQKIFQKSFGIDLAGQGKTIFYNDTTGIIMVRGTREDVAVIKGAIEMLGGMPNLDYQAILSGVGSGGGGGGTSGKGGSGTNGGFGARVK